MMIRRGLERLNIRKLQALVRDVIGRVRRSRVALLARRRVLRARRELEGVSKLGVARIGVLLVGDMVVIIGRETMSVLGHQLRRTFREPWTNRRKIVSVVMAIVVAVWSLQILIPDPARAAVTGGTSGKGLLAYGDGATKTRQWNFGNSAFGGESNPSIVRNPYQSVIKNSPVNRTEWVMGVVDSGGTLEILRSTNGGSSWSSGFTVSIGGSATRRFDIAFEGLSGEAVVVYSKNSTTNELGVRRFASGAWQSEATYDPSGTNSVVTWVELAEKSKSDELALSYLTNATTGINIGAGIWFGSVNIMLNPWTVSADKADLSIKSLVVDSANGVVYAGGNSGTGNIYRCAVSSGCDADADWTVSLNVAGKPYPWNALVIDTTTGVLYAGSSDETLTGTAGFIYRCPLSSSCDASADWAVSYDTPAINVYSLVFDSANGVIYAGTDESTGPVIYRCAINTTGSCNDSSDWTTSIALSVATNNAVRALTIDTTNGVLYAGTGASGNIFRCSLATTGSCNDSGDWTNYQVAASTTFYSLAFDTANNTLYAGGSAGGNGRIYRCVPAATGGCDQNTDWSLALTALSDSVINAVMTDTSNGYIYAGGSSGGLYRCSVGSGCDADADWSTPTALSTGIFALALDSANNTFYAATGSSGIIYTCTASTGCLNSNATGLALCDAAFTDTGGAGTPSGNSKCFDINYEAASGRPVLSWGIYSDGNTNGLIRATRWDGSGWTTTNLSLGTNSDDTTIVDCEADPSPGSNEIVCGSYGTGTLDVQMWAINYVGNDGANTSLLCGQTTPNRNYNCTPQLNTDTGAHAAPGSGSGRLFVATTYLMSGGNRKAVVAWATGTATTELDYVTYDGSVWGAATTATTTYSAQEENIIAVNNPYDYSEALFIVGGANSSLYAEKFKLTGATLDTPTAADGGAALETALPNLDGPAFDFAVEPRQPASVLSQTGYIWENDDGSAADGNTQQAAGSAVVANVKKGERLTLRTQIKNSGYGSHDLENLGLFYDRSDGVWAKVDRAKPFVSPGSSNCQNNTDNTDNKWECTTVQTGSVGGFTDYLSMAVAPDGHPWVAYSGNDGGAVRTLALARYVGSGGTGCASAAWTCVTVDDPSGPVGISASIAFDPAGRPWISYYEGSSGGSCDDSPTTECSLHVARYVGSGGSGCTGGTNNTAWTCAIVDNPATSDNYGSQSAIAVDALGTAWVSYQDTTLVSLKVAKYSPGTSASGTCAAGWTCTTVDDPSSGVGYNTSIALGSSDKPWVSYRDITAGSLKVAQYVGSGGSGCTASGGSGTTVAWSCTTVEDTADSISGDTSIAIDPTGNPWISYLNLTSTTLKVAQYVGSGGSGCTASTWSCTAVESPAGGLGAYTSLAFDPAGNPWIGYRDPSSSGFLKVARKVGGTFGTGCTGGSNAWSCTTVDDPAAATGEYTALAFDPSGNAWLAYRSPSAGGPSLRVANIRRGGDIWIAPAAAGGSGDSLSESHADMGLVSDTTNRDDADCIGSGTWNNGRFFEAAEGSGLTVAGAGGGVQCTEVGFVIDTSQAVAETTYRFVVASNDGWRSDKGAWRGPASVSAYATLTMRAVSDLRIGKDVQLKMTDCSDNSWGCATLNDPGNLYSDSTSMAVDPAGTPWVAFRGDNNGETAAGNGTLMVAKYVGSGGDCSSSAWDCTLIDDPTGGAGANISLAFSADGMPWIAYTELTGLSLRVARYVGSDGSGCTSSSAWSCTTIDNPSSGTISYVSLAIDPAGSAWISYQDTNASSSLRVARFVATGGTGCVGASGSGTTSDWTCVTVDDPTNAVGQYTSIAFNANGNAWISYRENTVDALKIAKYVGVGGSGCTSGTTAEWSCSTIDDPSGVLGLYTSLAFDHSGTAWISYHEDTSASCDDSPTTECTLHVAKYVGSGGSGCTAAGGAGTTSDWTCTIVDNQSGSNGLGSYSALAIDAAGYPLISYSQTLGDLSLKVAQYTPGASATGGCAADWVCTTVDSPDNVGDYTSIAFDQSGAAWVSYKDSTNASVQIAKRHLPTSKPAETTSGVYSGRNASSAFGRYRLDNGLSPRSLAMCGGVTDKMGYCGVAANDDQYDSLLAGANERPMYAIARTVTSTAEFGVVSWRGSTDRAPSSNNLKLEIFRFGTTNAWETLATNSNASCSECTLTGFPAGTLSEYFESGTNTIYYRVWQEAHATSITLKTDSFTISQARDFMRTGGYFMDGEETIRL